MVDMGYDISDYRDIAAEFGTLADFDRMVAEADKRGIRIIMDLVVNHCSNQHAWFRDACTGRDAEPMLGGPPDIPCRTPQRLRGSHTPVMTRESR